MVLGTCPDCGALGRRFAGGDYSCPRCGRGWTPAPPTPVAPLNDRSMLVPEPAWLLGVRAATILVVASLAISLVFTVVGAIYRWMPGVTDESEGWFFLIWWQLSFMYVPQAMVLAGLGIGWYVGHGAARPGPVGATAAGAAAVGLGVSLAAMLLVAGLFAPFVAGAPRSTDPSEQFFLRPWYGALVLGVMSIGAAAAWGASWIAVWRSGEQGSFA